jgi:hypothetical protein
MGAAASAGGRRDVSTPLPPMVTCCSCRARKRSVELWYLPRSGPPVLHAGLPAGWAFVRGVPNCPTCVKRDAQRLVPGRTA